MHQGKLLALIVSHKFNDNGLRFLTSDDMSQQLAFMRYPAGKNIMPHIHNRAERTVEFTRETLFIRSGKLRVDFYSDDKCYLESRILETGDVILLAGGGHGFEVIEEVEMIEVKQGPYLGERDRTTFTASVTRKAGSGGEL